MSHCFVDVTVYLSVVIPSVVVVVTIDGSVLDITCLFKFIQSAVRHFEPGRKGNAKRFTRDRSYGYFHLGTR